MPRWNPRLPTLRGTIHTCEYCSRIESRWLARSKVGWRLITEPNFAACDDIIPNSGAAVGFAQGSRNV
eukprot:scaffold430130_cov25-Prasinocladus_malaysianus.AAC.1